MLHMFAIVFKSFHVFLQVFQTLVTSVSAISYKCCKYFMRMFQKSIGILHTLQCDLLQLLGRRACAWGSGGMECCSATGVGSGGQWRPGHKQSPRGMQVRQSGEGTGRERRGMGGQRHKVGAQFPKSSRRWRQTQKQTTATSDVQTRASI
jgi:hypothetical protein